MRELFKKFGRTQLITLVGVVFALSATVLAAFGKLTGTLLFLSAALLISIFITAIIHRYLVSTRAATNRQFEKVRKLIEEQSELNSVILSEASTRTAEQKRPVTPQESPKISGRAKAAPAKKEAPVRETSSAAPPLRSPMISENDREVAVARAINRDPKSASRFALKVKSQRLRNSFARAASGYFYSYEQLISILRRLREDGLTDFETVKSWDADVLLALAQVLGNQRLTESDLDDARTILVVVAAVFGENKLSREDRLLLSEIVGECGDWETAAYILEALGLNRSNSVQYHFTLANQFAGVHGRASEWLEPVNEVFRTNGLSQVTFRQCDTTDLDQLQAEPLKLGVEAHSQPTVSVIMPTFEGASRIRTALNSLVSQSWKNLEILVVDDGSSDDSISALKEIVADYPIAKLVLLEENGGAYVARNAGLRLAKGEYFTVHDDDDWSHPQKIASQVGHLIENPDLVGTTSKHARVTEDLRFTRINRRPEFAQNNMSSLLLRTEDARALGGWHEVNRGADEEFTLRLQKATGKKIGCCSDIPLSFTRTHDRSLTSGEILRGFQHPSRMLYHSAFTAVHNELGAEYIKPDVKALPADMERDKRGAHLGTFDFGYVLDAKVSDFNQATALAELQHLDEIGYRVALVHHHSFDGATAPLVNPRVLELLENTGVQFLSFQNAAHFDHLIIRDPRAFEFAEDTASNVTANTVAVVSAAASTKSPVQERLARSALDGLCQVLGKQESEILRLNDWNGLAPFNSSQTHSLSTDAKPTVGRGPAPSSKQWPSKASEIKSAYAGNEIYDVVLVDNFDQSSSRIEKTLRQGADFVSGDTFDFVDFAEKIDFWVDMGPAHSEQSLEVLAALATGIVVMVRPGSEALYGDAVLYVKPDAVQSVVRRIVDFPELYKLQQKRGTQYLPELWSESEFEDYIKNLREK